MNWQQKQNSLRASPDLSKPGPKQFTVSTAPSPVDSVSKTAITATTGTLNWVYSAMNNPLLDFLVQVDLASGDYGDPVISQSVASNLRTLAITGLTAETDYKFRVIARNSTSLLATAVADTFTTAAS